MNKILLIVFVCFAASCGIRQHIEAKIDVSDFNAHQVNGTATLTIKHNFQLITTRQPDGSFVAVPAKPNSNYVWTAFYYPSGKFKTYTMATHGIKFSQTPLYDENGNLVSVIDNDGAFKYAINSLDRKFKHHYGFDLFKEGNFVVKDEVNGRPVYKVTVLIHYTDGDKRRRFIVDGVTGEILKDTVI